VTETQQLAQVQAALADSRLSLDSRAVAAWLVLHPWRHSAAALQAAFGLRRAVWTRVRDDLQAAGYLSISGPRRAGGHWEWDIRSTSRSTSPVDNSPAEHICRKPADEVMCRSSACWEPADTEVLLTKPEVIHKNCAGAQAPVDNPDQERASRKKQLYLIQAQLQWTKGQLGHIINFCKEKNCQLQDVFDSVGKYMEGVSGNRAVAYLKKCILENPGRDWTWEARRDAAREAFVESVQREDRAFEQFTRQICSNAAVAVQSPKTGERLTLRQRAEAPEFVNVLDAQHEVLGSLPVRMAFDQFISPGSE
jgi:hypothetical protein